MLELTQFLAAWCGALFAGAAVYINLVEHPARMAADTRTAAIVWAPSYERATFVQAPLAVVSCLAGGGGVVCRRRHRLAGGGGIDRPGGAVYLHRHHAHESPAACTRGDLAAAATGDLLDRWNRLHAVRSAWGVLASVVYMARLITD